MDLMTDERVILESDTKELVLTTHKVRFEASRFGKAYVASIMLENLCSCEIRHSSYPVLLVAAALAVILGYNEGEPAGAFGLILAMALVVIYFMSRRQVLTLRSAGAAINVQTRGMKLEVLRGFVASLEAAKNTRYLAVTTRASVA